MLRHVQNLRTMTILDILLHWGHLVMHFCYECGKIGHFGLGCLFLFDRNLFLGLKNSKKRIPEDFFFFLCFRRNFSQEHGFGGGLRSSCFSPLSQEFFPGITAGQEFLHLQRIPPDSSRFLRIPVPAKRCLALASN
jgi:hypothetical protein